ncbi:MAG: hypothetical protein H7Z37_00730, partial [Pyrinomonadaceae bacterium]|nr:hypothetical protein [Pyrinomonadaceae bacterium]
MQSRGFMVSYYDFHGDKIIIGKELGRGGEGTVYEIEGKPELAAKIYHEKISPNKTEKLLRMKALQNEKLLRVTTWTVDVLRGDQNGEIVGFVMPKLKFGTAIHELYNPKSRRHFFPEADWRFLIHTATNLARAFSVVHLQGHAIGDVNHGNIVIAKDATVRLIDCDSYQLNAPRSENGGAQSFLCEVGVSTHTPPELQGKSLRDVTRTENHDNFGLAVLIFQLLFMGRHPFSGKFLGEEETTLEDSIRENRFAYGDDAKSRKMQPPPATLSLSTVSQTVAENFRRAFLSNENRPTALEWIAALEQMTAELKQCSVNASHFHLKESKKCPWCSLESNSGIAFYPANLTGNFDIVTIGNLIDSIKPPLINNLPIKTNLSFITSSLPPSTEVKRELTDFYAFYAIFLTFVALITLAVSTFITYEISLALIVCGYFGCEKIIKNFIGDLQENAQLKLDNARQKRNSFYDNLNGNHLTKPFENLRGELKSTIKTYQNLPQEREFLVKKKGKQRYQRQLEIYLKNHKIEDSGLQGLNQVEIEILRKKNLVN